MTKTIDCTDCGASVPYGRLSCTSCGALLASVGGRPSAASASIDVPEPTPEPFLLPDDDDVTPSIWTSLPEQDADAPPPVLAGRPYRLSVMADSTVPVGLRSVPGAYRPARMTLSDAAAGSGAGATTMAGGHGSSPMAAPSTTAPGSRAGTLDPTRLADIASWFVVVGATMAVLGFLLPWSSAVIGARGVGSYLDTWGLASPTHVLVLGATMLVLALGVIRTAVPVWLRSGVLPLGLGSLLIGLAWPYAIGPLGADVGIVVIVLGAIAMVIGGVVTTWAIRHVEVDPFV